ncbi:MAG TPA: TIGR03118 family protein [Caulobacteraceae bacterium]
MKTSLLFGVALAGLLAHSALAGPVKLTDYQLNAVVAGTDFQVANLIADRPNIAPTTDPDLVNAWGLSSAPGGPLWVANNGTGTSTVYDPNSFAKLGLTVSIPGPDGGPAAPTGTVFTSLTASDFAVSQGGKTGHSIFLFDTEDGTISGWSPSVNGTQAIIAVNDSTTGAVFKGLTIAPVQHSQYLYAADFANNRVDMFNGQFQQIGSFTDASLPAGYAPFNVQTLNGLVYVAFAKHGEGLDEAHGHGLGYVDIYTTHGQFVRRLVASGPLNAPWGLAIAPASFGEFAGALLVGNFGSGVITAFNATTGAYMGQLKDNGKPVVIPGLWALAQGPDGEIIFSSGPNDEANGLVGAIRPAAAAASWASRAHATR